MASASQRPAPSTPGRHRKPLFDQIVRQHRDMRDRLQALNQARHDGHDPAEVEAVRRAVWALHQATGRRS